jgi:cysteinyl-tRNA synthetase
MDLLFPHHECEIAQAVAAQGKDPVRYWIHNNMITINGQKMGKSLGNFITLNEFFSGSHAALNKAFSPMSIRFFILQAHYRGTLDFSNDALQASEKGLERLMSAHHALQKLQPGKKTTVDIEALKAKCYEALNDDLNTPILISNLFEGVRIINAVKTGTEELDSQSLDLLKWLFNTFIVEILGLVTEQAAAANNDMLNGMVEMLLTMRVEAKQRKDFAASDMIRNRLTELGVKVKDTKDGFEWEL